MAFETELANASTQTDTISAAISAAFVQGPVLLPLIFMEPLPEGTNIKKWRKDGSLAAEILAESAAYSFSSSSELTQSDVSSTAAKHVVVSKLTVEAEQFSSLSVADMITKQAQAISRDLDDEIKTLISGFSTQVIASSTLTKDDLLDAEFTVLDATAGISTGRLNTVLDYKGANEVKKEISSDGGGAWANTSLPGLVGLLQTQRGINGFAGTFMSQDIYTTKGLPTDTGDDVGITFDGDLAFGAMLGDIRTDIWFDSSLFVWQIASYVFYDVIEWNDEAGVGVRSDS